MRRWVLWLACAASAFVVAEAVGGQPRRLACAIPLKGEIDAHLVESLSERLTQATRESRDSDDEKLTTSLVLLDLAVTGGPLDLALDLAEQIHNSKLETVAFVRKPGSAAATLLALACDRVFLANGARLVALDPAAFGSPDATATLLETVDAFSSERPRLHALYRGMVDPALAVHAVLEKGKQGKYSFFDGPEYEKKRASLQVKAYESVSEVGERAALTAADARRLTVIAGIEDSVGAVAGTFHVPGSLLVVLEQKGAATTTTTATKDRAAKSRDRNIPKTGPVVIIRLDGVVGKGMLHSVKRRLREAVALEPALLVFEMDTWGGALEEALDISDRIFDLEKPHTIAFVNDKAISAGVLISVACDEIFMVRGGKIGDCQVVTGSGEKVGREKIDTVLRAQFRTFCEGKYPLALSEAMVNEKAEIYQVTTRDGETEFLTGEQWENLTAAEREGYMPGSEKKILSDTKLLTMTDTEAVQLGFSTATVRDRAELLDTLGLSAREQITLDWTWSELFVRWLERVGPVFLTLGILGIIIELKTPGFGIPGILGLALIAVFFVGQHSAGMAEAWEIMLFGVGVALLAVEVFLIPGFGFVGLAGLLCMVASVLLSLQPFTVPQSTADWSMFEVNVMSLGMVTLGVFIGALLIGRYLHKAPYLGKLVLASPPPSTSPTATSRSVLSMPTQQAVDERASELVGRQGRAISLLRPAGRAEFDGEPMDVVTQGDFIQAGEPIEICEVHGNRVVVARRTSAES